MLKSHILTVVAVTAAVVCILTGIFTLIFFQPLADRVISSRLPLQEGRERFEYWRNPPATPFLRVYFFNVTNGDEFLKSNGTIKLAVMEFGPYTYSQKLEKVNVTWNPNGTISYRPKKIYSFQRNLSCGPEEDAYVLPNMPVLSALSSVKYSSKISKTVLARILNVLKLGPFYQRSVKEVMWGYEDPLLKVGKSFLPEEKRLPDDKFGLFYGKNDTPGKVYTVFSGQEKLSDYARINVWDGKEGLGRQQKADTPCNMINGTDATGFPPMLNGNSTVYIFQADLCRSLELKYREPKVEQELPVFRFVPSESVFGDVETYPENQCYCADGPPCSRPGTFNISTCQLGAPVFVSWPHFLHGDPSLGSVIDGLHPDPALHEFYIDIQPKLGIPMEAKARVQINIQMSREPEIPQGAQLGNVLIPVIWFEDGIDKLPESLMDLMRQAVFVPGIVELAITVASFGFGFIICICELIVLRNSYVNKRNQDGRSPPDSKQTEDKSKESKNEVVNPGTNGELEMESRNGHGNGVENLGYQVSTEDATGILP